MFFDVDIISDTSLNIKTVFTGMSIPIMKRRRPRENPYTGKISSVYQDRPLNSFDEVIKSNHAYLRSAPDVSEYLRLSGHFLQSSEQY